MEDVPSLRPLAVPAALRRGARRGGCQPGLGADEAGDGLTRRLRVGILGAGAAAAEIHAPGYAACQSAELVAVASATRASAHRLAERFGIPTVHPTPEGLLHDPDVDAVSICTPPAFHRDLAEQACAAG